LGAGIAFVAAIACALALSCAISTLVNISLLWTIAGDGLVMLQTATVSFLSGILIPLPLFPDWAQTLLGLLPFAGVVDLPFRIYTGHIGLADVPFVLARQLAWTAILIVFGRWLLARGLRRVVVHGG
jgi:ABC-2 type transport system permease protein